jgi:endonuclease III
MNAEEGGAGPIAPLPLFLDRLEAEYGPLEPSFPTDAVGLLLWENVAYLVDDSRRGDAFDALVASVGRQPADILAARDADLLAVVAGMRPGDRVARLRRVAELAMDLDLFPDPAPVLRQPLAQARRLLRRFPGTGDPGADRILLFGHHHNVLALDSNALRVLVRLGIGHDSDNYQRSYRSAQSAAQAMLAPDGASLIRASLLLRRHGQELCRRSQPRCPVCPLRLRCPTGARPAMSGNIRHPA